MGRFRGGGETYLNIHTTQFPGGEIRGYLVAPPLSGVSEIRGVLIRLLRSSVSCASQADPAVRHG